MEGSRTIHAEPASKVTEPVAAPPIARGASEPDARGDLLNARAEVTQLREMTVSLSKGRAARAAPVPIQKPNSTGLPDRLKMGIDRLSGLALDDVRVHFASPEPAQLQALAFARGTDIHVGPGQEKHLPHEAWHVVQQKQGRVRATRQLKGAEINDDQALEREADLMGARAAAAVEPEGQENERPPARGVHSRGGVAQRVYIWSRGVQAAPVWIEENEPPVNPPYLESGTHSDGVHGTDRLYVRFSPQDTIYGLYFDEGDELNTFREGFFPIVEDLAGTTLDELTRSQQEALFRNAAVMIPALARYEEEVGKPLLDYALIQAIYGGETANVNWFKAGGGKRDWALRLKTLNPSFPWNDGAAFPSQVSIAATLAKGGTVRFLLDGIKDVSGILDGTSEHAGKITSHELRIILDMLAEPIELPPEEDEGEGRTVVARDGTNVFFYLNRKLVPAAVVRWVTSDKAALAEQLAGKLADEEEWDEDEDSDAMVALTQALAGSELSAEDLLACLQLS